MKKPVIRSPLELMPLHQKQALAGWLTTGGKHGIGLTYEEAALKLKAEFGVTASTGTLSTYYRRKRLSPEVSAQTSFDHETKTVHIVIHLR